MSRYAEDKLTRREMMAIRNWYQKAYPTRKVSVGTYGTVTLEPTGTELGECICEGTWNIPDEAWSGIREKP